MPGSATISRGNISVDTLLQATLSPASVANATVAEQTFTVQGLQLGDFVNVSKPTTQTGLGIVNSRVSAANTLAIAFINVTAATITPTAAEIYEINVSRPENAQVPLPTALV
jgi:hypothetical protein